MRHVLWLKITGSAALLALGAGCASTGDAGRDGAQAESDRVAAEQARRDIEEQRQRNERQRQREADQRDDEQGLLGTGLQVPGSGSLGSGGGLLSR